MDTISRSWALVKESYAILCRVPSLVVFPILSCIATTLVTISFIVPIYMVTGGKDLQKTRPEIGYPIMFLFYFLTYFVVIFFNSAMCACAYEGLQDRETTFAFGIGVATKRLGAILGWTAIASTVGVILRTIAERTGILGNIVVGLFGFAWNVATFFVVPVIVIDTGSPVQAVKKSSEMLKQTWGERLVVAVGLGIAMSLFSLVGIVLIVLGVAVGMSQSSMVMAVPFVAVGIVYLLVLATVSAALQGIFQTALYLYASTGNAPSGFSAVYIQGAFRPKESKFGGFDNNF